MTAKSNVFARKLFIFWFCADSQITCELCLDLYSHGLHYTQCRHAALLELQSTWTDVSWSLWPADSEKKSSTTTQLSCHLNICTELARSQTIWTRQQGENGWRNIQVSAQCIPDTSNSHWFIPWYSGYQHSFGLLHREKGCIYITVVVKQTWKSMPICYFCSLCGFLNFCKWYI